MLSVAASAVVESGAFQSAFHRRRSVVAQFAKKKKSKQPAAKGFGNVAASKKTYVPEPISDFDEHDSEEAMSQFFQTYSEWHPLFAQIIKSPSAPATAHVNIVDSEASENKLTFGEESPWLKLPQMPSGEQKEEHILVISEVLDAFQKALTDIPVNEISKEEDEHDLQFLEEGRRMLLLTRFNVVNAGSSSQVDLFRFCWSEIHHLVTDEESIAAEGGSGSLIILDDSDDDSLDFDHFVKTCIRLPLSWMGMGDAIEVAGLDRGRSCVRLIYNVGAIPDLAERDRQIDEFVDGLEK